MKQNTAMRIRMKATFNSFEAVVGQAWLAPLTSPPVDNKANQEPGASRPDFSVASPRCT
jgi:hypothetical protein